MERLQNTTQSFTVDTGRGLAMLPTSIMIPIIKLRRMKFYPISKYYRIPLWKEQLIIREMLRSCPLY